MIIATEFIDGVVGWHQHILLQGTLVESFQAQIISRSNNIIAKGPRGQRLTRPFHAYCGTEFVELILHSVYTLVEMFLVRLSFFASQGALMGEVQPVGSCKINCSVDLHNLNKALCQHMLCRCVWPGLQELH